ncbi:MAG: sialate O-acetylesterase [bacterium]|nr:sialate O-acetylesterase [bacterium]
MNTTLLFAVAALCGAADPEPVDLYILTGQSNMQGLGKLPDIAEDLKRPIPRAKFWNGDQFEDLRPGITPISAKPNAFGPELAFARATASACERPVYLVKFFHSGKALDAGWNNQKWIGDPPGPRRVNFHPGEERDDPNVGVCYQQMMTTVTSALAWLQSNDVDATVRGIVWMQGEQDSKNPMSAARYAKNLRRFHQRLIEDIGCETCPLVFGQVLPHEPPAERFTNRDEVRLSQLHADHASGHPDAIPNVWMVSTDGIPVLPDDVHYTSQGQLTLGQRFADTMALALSPDSSAQRPWYPTPSVRGSGSP